nr:uncharacterized protein LOC113811455 [Penaeus vannamei]
MCKMVSKTATMQSSGERWRKSLENILCVNQDPAEAIGHSDIFFLVYGLNSLPVWNKMSPVMKGRLTQTLGEFFGRPDCLGSSFYSLFDFLSAPFSVIFICHFDSTRVPFKEARVDVSHQQELAPKVFYKYLARALPAEVTVGKASVVDIEFL